MKRPFSFRRAGVFALAAGLLFLIAGDRGMSQIPQGIDPLEVLNLQIKPNVGILLDTSGSMTETPYGSGTNRGDHAGTKIYEAKQVLRQVVLDNQNSVNFMFGDYLFSGQPSWTRCPGGACTGDYQINATLATGNSRFAYATTSWGAVAAVPLPVQGPSPAMDVVGTEASLNNLYAWQWIQNSPTIQNNKLVFSEVGGPTCTATVLPGFYTTLTIGPAIAAAMNTAPCVRANTYTVGYAAGVFTFSRAGVRDFTLLWTDPGTTLDGPMRAAGPQGPGTGPFTTADTRINLLDRLTWKSITIQNNTLVFNENGGPTCTVSVTPGSYTTTTIGPAIAAAMNTCPGRANTYAVTAGAGVVFSTVVAPPARQFTLQWANPTTTLDGPMGAIANQGAGNGPFTTPAYEFTDPTNYDPDGTAGPSPTRAVTTYWLLAQKVWNGETVQVDGAGVACNVIPGAASANPTVTLQRLSACGGAVVSTNVFTWSGGVFGGAGTCRTGYVEHVSFFNCRAPQNSTSPVIQPFLDNQLPLNGTGGITGYTEATDGTGAVLAVPAGGGVVASGNTPMAQSFDGFRYKFGGYGGALSAPLISPPPPNAAPGPWTGTGTGMWQGGQALPFPNNLTAISTHPNPKEKTILIMVTDGDQNCTPFTLGSGASGAPYNPTSIIRDDSAALGAAMAAQKLYDPTTNGTNPAGTFVNADGTITGDPAASVTTYLIAFGNGAAVNRSNWIAWGGSGMKRTGANVGVFGGSDTWTTVPTAAERAACKTCVDAFIAPDAATLEDVLNKLLNAGATTGEFTAQQSLSDSVFEYVGEAPVPITAPATVAFSSINPGTRYGALSPVRFASTFSMPLFTGQLRAFTNDGPDPLTRPTATCLPGNACERWDGNARLVNRVSTGMTAPGTVCTAVAAAGVPFGQCNFKRLAGAPTATDANVAASVAAIKRRIYTTSQNGVFGPTVDNLLQGQSPFRIALWPPQIISPLSVAPQDDTSEGLFDVALGLPPDSTPAANQAAAFATLRTSFLACTGAPLPGACTGTVTAQMQRARREARELLLAFIAGAQFVPDSGGNLTRATATSGLDYVLGDILYSPRTSILAESTLATPAVIGAPQDEEPVGTSWVDEWKLYRDGPRCTSTGCPPSGVATAGGHGFSSGINVDDGTFIRAGFGLRNPDEDGDAPNSGVDSFGNKIPAPDLNMNVKPVMTVVYIGTNAGLHAFRAGPNKVTGPGVSFIPVALPGVPVIPNNNPVVCVPSATDECGGEELWAFVPFDELGKLQARYRTNPQKRSPHDYMIARAVRFSDVFIPNPGTAADPDGTIINRTPLSGAQINLQGVWRKVIFFGRGIGGNSLTAIDVTAPGPFTQLALTTTGPIVLWNRGNPDTSDGKLFGGGNLLNNPAQGTGLGSDYDRYLRMGQTWSVPGVAFVDRGTNKTSRKPVKGADFVLYAGSGYGTPAANPVQGTNFYTMDALTGDMIAAADVQFRTNMAYDNAIVANGAVFNTSRFAFNGARNVAAAKATRVYFGDIHGRVWKVLASDPNFAILFADLGANQAVGSAAAIIGLPADDPSLPPAAKFPHVMISSGNEPRATGPFNNFGFIDDTTSDTCPAPCSPPAPVIANGVSSFPPARSLFSIPFDTNFRGTVQPLVTLTDLTPLTTNDQATSVLGRVFFAGTRFNPIGSLFAPTDDPCRSSFDSQVFALGVESGQAAYDFGPSKTFQNSRIAAVTVGGSPSGSKLIIDEGLVKSGQPVPPPPQMGVAPSSVSASANVVPTAKPGQPAPGVRFGSTVCQ